jgi:hypothetical protein
MEWTALLPILIALFAGAIGVVVTNFLLKPYLGYRKLLRKISYTLIFHAGLIRSRKFSDGPEEHLEVLNKIRSLAVKLRLSRSPVLQELGLMPSSVDLKNAAGLMFRISGRMYEEKRPVEELTADSNEIARLLGIDIGSWESKPKGDNWGL